MMLPRGPTCGGLCRHRGRLCSLVIVCYDDVNSALPFACSMTKLHVPLALSITANSQENMPQLSAPFVAVVDFMVSKFGSVL
jgi:hypothetical protein